MPHLQFRGIGIILGGGINLDLNAAEARVGQSRTGVVSNQVLCAQLVADLAESGVQLLQTAGVEVLPAGIAGELDERMFSADVAAGAVFDGNDDDAVQDDLRLLRLANCFLIARLADRVAAIGNHDHDLAAAPLEQRVGAEIQRVVQRGGRSRVDAIDGAVNHPQVRGERRDLVHDFAELEERQAIDGTQDGMREAARGLYFKLLITTRAEAGVNGDDNRERQLRFAMKDRDLLRLVIFEYLEVLLLERCNRRSVAVGDGGKYVHQLDIDLEGCARLLVWLGRGRLLLNVGWMWNGVRRLRFQRVRRMRDGALRRLSNQRCGTSGATERHRERA